MDLGRKWTARLVGVLSQGLHVFFGFGPCCRYQPTCTGYFKEAVAAHGGLKGSFLAARRLFRCGPWGGFGLDPVPGPNGSIRKG